MQLLISPASPYVRKVRVLLRETGLLDRVTEVTVVTSPMASDPAVVAANPLGKIPALIRDDGPAIYDSRVITRYLDAQAGAGLYPQSRLWEVLTLEATADAIMDSAVGMAYELRFRSDAQQYPDWLENQWAKIARALAALNTSWTSHLAGPLDASHIAVGCALGYLDLRHGPRNWRNGNDALAAWYDRFAARDTMRETAPEHA